MTHKLMCTCGSSVRIEWVDYAEIVIWCEQSDVPLNLGEPYPAGVLDWKEKQE